MAETINVVLDLSGQKKISDIIASLQWMTETSGSNYRLEQDVPAHSTPGAEK